MYIKHIVWRKLIYGQIRRLTLGMNVPKTCRSFRKLRADHALEWGNKNENPGVWANFVNFNTIPITPKYYSVQLDNCRNNLKLWQGENNQRGNKIKISQRIWTESVDIVDVWYLGSMKILENLLAEYNKTQLVSDDSIKLYDFICKRLEKLRIHKENLFEWARYTQQEFKKITINPNFLFGDFFIKTKKSYLEHNYLLIMCFVDDNQQERNHALMANIEDETLHPILRTVITGDCGATEINKIVE